MSNFKFLFFDNFNSWFAPFSFSLVSHSGEWEGRGGERGCFHITHGPGDSSIWVSNMQHFMFVHLVIDKNGGGFCGDGECVSKC